MMISSRCCAKGIICSIFHIVLGKLLNYVMTEHERNIAAFKEYMPAKALRPDSLKILWIQAPLHQNFSNCNLRKMFNTCVEEVVRLHSNTHSLMLKHVWNPKDNTLFLRDSNHFTAEGYTAYWEAVDRTVRYFDSVVLKKIQQNKVKNLRNVQHFLNGDQKDRFRWQKAEFNVQQDVKVQRLLPPPP